MAISLLARSRSRRSISTPPPASASRIFGSVSFTDFVLVFARLRHPRRRYRHRSQDRPVFPDQPDLAVLMDHLAQFRFDLAAIRALIVEIFDDRDVAIDVSRHRD